MPYTAFAFGVLVVIDLLKIVFNIPYQKPVDILNMCDHRMLTYDCTHWIYQLLYWCTAYYDAGLTAKRCPPNVVEELVGSLTVQVLLLY